MALGRTEILEKPLEESKTGIRYYFIFILMGCGDSILCRLPDEVNYGKLRTRTWRSKQTTR